MFLYVRGKSCSNYAKNIRCHHTKFSHARFMHPCVFMYYVLLFLLGDFSKQTDVKKNFLLLMDISEVILFKLVDISFSAMAGLRNYSCVRI
jgi:hypothetical protein